MYEGVALGGLWKLMSWLPGFLLRWVFSKEALAARVRIDVRNRPHAVQINGGDISGVEVSIVIHNAGYFAIELDRVSVTLSIPASVELFDLDRVLLRPDATHEVHLKAPISPGVVALYKINKGNEYNFSVRVRAEFNSKIHNFSVRPDYMSGLAIRAINC